MSDNVFLNADRSAVVDETDPGKKWKVRRKDAIRLGLITDADAKPQVRRSAPEDVVRPMTGTTPRQDTERTFTTTSSPATPKRVAKK